MKLATVKDRYIYFCPACGNAHGPNHTWTFNGDHEKPTLSPSILVRWDFGPERAPKVCHHFVRDGKIEYLNDCTHPLAGQTIPMEDL